VLTAVGRTPRPVPSADVGLAMAWHWSASFVLVARDAERARTVHSVVVAADVNCMGVASMCKSARTGQDTRQDERVDACLVLSSLAGA
jgi:hypothetical protein